jgi:hypothetical protein
MPIPNCVSVIFSSLLSVRPLLRSFFLVDKKEEKEKSTACGGGWRNERVGQKEKQQQRH